MVGLRMVQESENKAYQEQLVQNTAATMWTAGTDTTVSALATFILAILSNPEAQKKAQAEIDAVVGTDRLPDFDDEPHLPYVAALMKESMSENWRIPDKVLTALSGHIRSCQVLSGFGCRGIRTHKDLIRAHQVWLEYK